MWWAICSTHEHARLYIYTDIWNDVLPHLDNCNATFWCYSLKLGIGSFVFLSDIIRTRVKSSGLFFQSIIRYRVSPSSSDRPTPRSTTVQVPNVSSTWRTTPAAGRGGTYSMTCMQQPTVGRYVTIRRMPAVFAIFRIDMIALAEVYVYSNEIG